MDLARRAYFFLILQPFVLMALALNFHSSGPTPPLKGSFSYQDLREQLYQQHGQLTDLKLTYGRLPHDKRERLDPQFKTIHQLYEKAVSQLQKFENASEEKRSIHANIFLEIRGRIGSSQNLLAQKTWKVLNALERPHL